MIDWLHSAIAYKKGVPTLIVVLVCLVYVAGELARAGGDPLDFVIYDGHYVYQIALRFSEKVNIGEEAPAAYSYRDEMPSAYRWQRILYPGLAWLLAFGRPRLVLWTLIMVNIAAIGVGTWVTESLLRRLGVSRWYALVYGLYSGQFVALRSDMAEPLAQALVQLAIWAWMGKRRGWATVAFALAVLTKETALLFLAAFVLYSLIQREWRWVISLGASAIPYFAYQGLLWLGTGETGLTSGQPLILIPFGGWLQIAGMHFGAFLLISLMIVPLSVLPAVAGIILSWRSLGQRVYHPFVLSLLFNSVFLLFLPHLTFREVSAMARVTQGLVVSMLLYGALTRSGRILNYSVLWLFSGVILVKGAA